MTAVDDDGLQRQQRTADVEGVLLINWILDGKFWSRGHIVDKGNSEDHQSPTLWRCACGLFVVAKTSLFPVQKGAADGVVPRGIGVARFDIETDASAGTAL
jgi:hypothetical protein